MLYRLIKPALLLGLLLLIGNPAHSQGSYKPTGHADMQNRHRAWGSLSARLKGSRANSERTPAGPRITLAE